MSVAMCRMKGKVCYVRIWRDGYLTGDDYEGNFY